MKTEAYRKVSFWEKTVAFKSLKYHKPITVTWQSEWQKARALGVRRPWRKTSTRSRRRRARWIRRCTLPSSRRSSATWRSAAQLQVEKWKWMTVFISRTRKKKHGQVNKASLQSLCWAQCGEHQTRWKSKSLDYNQPPLADLRLSVCAYYLFCSSDAFCICFYVPSLFWVVAARVNVVKSCPVSGKETPIWFGGQAVSNKVSTLSESLSWVV